MAYKKTNKLIEYNNDYNKTHYDRISLLVPQGKKEIIKQQAELNGESVNAFINRAIEAELARQK